MSHHPSKSWLRRQHSPKLQITARRSFLRPLRFERLEDRRVLAGEFADISAGLPGLHIGSVAWGDYDNDGDLDILLTGLDGDGRSISRVYQNNGSTFNSVPAAPDGLTATLNSATSVTFAWTATSDTQTPSVGLNYNLRVGTTPGGSDVVGPMSFQNPPSSQTDGLRKIAQRGLVQGTSWTLENLTPGQTYYWSVQAIDTALAGSPFAAEGSFAIVPDFGDAPDTYLTLLAGNGGAAHVGQRFVPGRWRGRGA